MSERASEHLMRHYAGFIPCGGLKEATPSPAVSSPAGDTRPAIRTEYAGRTSFIAVGRSYRDHSGDVWTDPSCDDVGTWYLTSQRYGTRERFFADGRHWAAPGSSQDLVAVVGAPLQSRFRPVVVDEKDFVSIGDFIAKLEAEPPLPVRRLRNEFADAPSELRTESDEDRPGDLFRKYDEYCEKERLTCFPRDASSSYTETRAEADVETALRATPDFALGFEDDPPLTSRELRWQAAGEIVVLSVISGLAAFVIAGSAFGLAVVFGWVG